MSVNNSHHRWRKSFTSTKLLNWLTILTIIISIIAFVIVTWNLQDIYWEKCQPPELGTQPHNSLGFNIVNDSFFKSSMLTFTVTVDVPPAKISIAKTLDELNNLLNDPNTLSITFSDNKNTLQGKHPFGTDSTIIKIRRGAGLESHTAAMINFLWHKDKNVRLVDVQFYSGIPTSPYYKKYPNVSERKFLVQTKWQIIVCLAIMGAAILTTILFKMLLSTQKKLGNITKELADTDTKLSNANTELANTNKELDDTKSKLDKALQAIQGTKVSAILPVEEDAAKEYQQKSQEEATQKGSAEEVNVPIADLHLSLRVTKCLESINVELLFQLVQLTEADLLKIRGFGEKSLEEVKRRLADIGLSLAMTDDT